MPSSSLPTGRHYKRFVIKKKVLSFTSVRVSSVCQVFVIFSAFLTALLNFPQILKASAPEKKQPVTPKHQNGALQKKEVKENPSKDISKNNACPRKTDTGKKVTHKPLSSGVVPADSRVKVKVPAAAETKKSAAPKRKKDNGKSASEQEAKKKKAVVEEKKPTE